jgi:hypothetical protein
MEVIKMPRIQAYDVALLVNSIADLIVLLRKVAPEITPENIDEKVAERQAEVYRLDEQVNA